MAQRHKSRQYALQMLFQWEIGRQDPKRIEDGFWRIARAEKSTRAFADSLFEAVVRNATELDGEVSKHIENWRLERLAVIDRAILRLAVQELREGDAPRKVVVNEAVELAKTFSSEDSAGFVNGVLDSVLHSLAGKKPKQDLAKSAES
jgi:N utilization substance protein B